MFEHKRDNNYIKYGTIGHGYMSDRALKKKTKKTKL